MDRNVNERQIVIFASPERLKGLKKEIDWKTAVATGLIHRLAWPISFGYVLWQYFAKKPQYPYPIYDPRTAKAKFRFPVQHPQDGVTYACCEAEPDLYVPLASFHQFMYESKMEAFNALCRNLGAKRCSVIYAEENGFECTAKFKADDIPTSNGPVSGGASININRNDKATAKAFFEYEKPRTQIKGSSSIWMNGEATWRSMQSGRLENGLKSFQAEFTYDDNLGISAELAGKISSIGLSIGGDFKEMSQRRWIFEVEFWDID